MAMPGRVSVVLTVVLGMLHAARARSVTSATRNLFIPILLLRFGDEQFP